MTLNPPKITVCIPHPFEGPLHSRLLQIWKTEADLQGFDLRIYKDMGLGHADVFEHMWEENNERGGIIVLTELDFIPSIDFSKSVLRASCKAPISCASYTTREPGTLRLQRSEHSAGWFFAIDTRKFKGELDMSGPKDPGTRVSELHDCHMESGADDRIGITYSWGTHLFWSRAIYDPCHVGTGFIYEDILAYWRSRIESKELEQKVRER